MMFSASIIFVLCVYCIDGRPEDDNSLQDSSEIYGNMVKKIFSKRTLLKADVNDTITFSQEVYQRWSTFESILGYSNIEIMKGSPSHGEFIDSFPEPEALEMLYDSLVAGASSAHMMYEFCNFKNVDRKLCGHALRYFKLWNTPLSESCNKLSKRCSEEEKHSQYRSIDGSCNNLAKGILGQSFTVYYRLLYPNYLDGIRQPARSVTKDEMPSANAISSSLYLDYTLDKNRSLAVLYWGQFLEHDLSHTAMGEMVHTRKPIECCSQEGWINSPRYLHPFCFPISVSPNDKYYAAKDMNCISYVRSISSVGPYCSLGPIQQINQATHFLDGSQIYGANQRLHRDLRNYTNGHLKSTFTTSDPKLPVLQLSKEPEKFCGNGDKTRCFESGDKRVNENPYITSLYTLWLREHNRIASELKIVNPMWDSETIFNEARRIVIAEMQHITYTEWIPSVLGISIEAGDYDPNENPDVSNAFATAAIRALHSVGSGRTSSFQDEKKLNSKSTRSMEKYLKEITSEYFRGRSLRYIGKVQNTTYGYDILSLDIQRGRDHGIPSYNKFRKYCGLRKADNFQSLAGIMLLKTIESLKKNYRTVEDIDLIVGGLSEIPQNGIFGPTLTCLLQNQFQRTMRADRYFYTNENQPNPFSNSQLRDIKKMTLARIICDNTATIEKIQPRVFERVGGSNAIVSCSSNEIPKINFNLWSNARYKYE